MIIKKPNVTLDELADRTFEVLGAWNYRPEVISSNADITPALTQVPVTRFQIARVLEWEYQIGEQSDSAHIIDSVIHALQERQLLSSTEGDNFTMKTQDTAVEITGEAAA